MKTDAEKLAEIKDLCSKAEKSLPEDVVQDILEGGNGQFDDSFYAGERNGEGCFAERILVILNAWQLL